MNKRQAKKAFRKVVCVMHKEEEQDREHGKRKLQEHGIRKC